MNKRLQSLKDNYLDEIRSFITSFLAILAVDGAMQLMAIYNGDFSEATLYALLAAMGRSLVKLILCYAFPTVFPMRKSNLVLDKKE